MLMICFEPVHWMTEKKREALEAKLIADRKHTKQRMDAMQILHTKGDLTALTQNKFTMPENKTLLQWKLGKTTGKKADLITRYINTPPPPPRTNTFTAAEGERLEQLQKGEMSLKETALGNPAKQNARAVIHHLDELDSDEKAQLLLALTKDDKRGQPKDDRDYKAGVNNVL